MSSSKFSRLIVIAASLLCSPGLVHAAIDTYQWQLEAIVDVTATIAGKTIKLRNQTLSALDAVFENDQQFVMNNPHWQLSGTWSQTKNRFQLLLSDDSARRLLSTLEHDLLAQSNLGVQLTAKSHQGIGSEKQSPTPRIQGRLPIKATLLFPAYSTKKGSLTFDIRFTGQPATVKP